MSGIQLADANGVSRRVDRDAIARRLAGTPLRPIAKSD
jgi:hypothetical protein